MSTTSPTRLSYDVFGPKRRANQSLGTPKVRVSA